MMRKKRITRLIAGASVLLVLCTPYGLLGSQTVKDISGKARHFRSHIG